jgi:hypothetical protein
MPDMLKLHEKKAGAVSTTPVFVSQMSIGNGRPKYGVVARRHMPCVEA